MKFKVVPGDGLSQTLRSEIQSLANSINQRLDDSLATLAKQGEGKAKDWAATRLNSTRQQYESALNAVQIGPNKWAVTLDASAAHLEDGFPTFDMKPGLLNSKAIVKSGKNAGQPWVRRSKDGFRYAIVPMDQSGGGRGAGKQSPDSQIQQQNPVTRGTSGNLQRDGGKPEGLQTRGDLMSDMKSMIGKAGLRGITKDASGAPILGKVATVRANPSNPNSMTVNVTGQQSRTASMGTSLGGRPNQVNPLLNGLVKYQYEVKKRDGGTMVKSAYMTFRVVSEKQKSKWIHPGFMGVKIFDDLESWAQLTLPKLVEEALQAG